MDTSPPFADIVSRYVKRSTHSYEGLAQRAGLAGKTTISNWVNGKVKRPRHWQDLVKLARVLGLTEDEVNSLLAAASHPTIETLLQTTPANSDDYQIFLPWLEVITDRQLRPPFQVPYPQTDSFVGRTVEQEQIQQVLLTGSQVCALHGMGGMGKTTLTVHMSYSLRDHFPDGVLWAQVNGPDSLMPILKGLAQAYGRDVSQDGHISSRSAIVRQLLAYKQALLILDNVQTKEELDVLLPSVGQCSVLITTRNRKIITDRRIKVISLNALTASDSRQLLAHILSQARIDAESSDANELIYLVDGLPLALHIAASTIAETDFLTLAEYCQLLRDEKKSLDVLEDGEDAYKSIRSSFEISYRLLNERLQQLFSALSVFNGADFSVEAVAAVIQEPLPQVKVDMGRLKGMALTTAVSPTPNTTLPQNIAARYQMHPLLKYFAREKLHSSTPYHNVATYFATMTQTHHQNYHLLAREWENVYYILHWLIAKRQTAESAFLSTQPLVELTQLVTKYFNQEELRTLCFELGIEYENLPAEGKNNKARELISQLNRLHRIDDLITIGQRVRPRVRWQAEASLLEVDLFQLTAQIVQNLTMPHLGTLGFIDAYGHWQQIIPILQHLLLVTSTNEQADFHFKLGAFALRLADRETAVSHLQTNLTLLEPIHNERATVQRTAVYAFMARLAEQQNQQEAIAWITRGLAELEALDTKAATHQRGYLYIQMARIYGRRTQFEQAVATAQKGLDLLPTQPTSAHIASFMILSNVHAILGDTEQAIVYQQKGIDIAQSLGDFYRLAALTSNFATSNRLQGNIDKAVFHYEKALILHQRMGNVSSEVVAQMNLGICYTILGKDEFAYQHLETAVQLAQTHQLNEREAFAQTNLAYQHIQTGRLTQAHQALQVASLIGQQRNLIALQPSILYLQAEVARLQEDLETAVPFVDEAIQLAQEKDLILAEGIAWSTKGKILDSQQQYDQAYTAHQTSLQLLERQEPYDLAHSQLAFANHYILHCGYLTQEAQKLLNTAQTTFQKLTAQRAITQCQTLLDEASASQP